MGRRWKITGDRFRRFTPGERGALHWALRIATTQAGEEVLRDLSPSPGPNLHEVTADAKDAATLGRLLLECIEAGDDS